MASNTNTDSLVIRLEDQSGLTGYGEGVPRPYVTGESRESASAFITEKAAASLLGREFEPCDVWAWFARNFAEQAIDAAPAAVCALETALLDLAGRLWQKSMSDFLGGRQRAQVTYGAVIPFAGRELHQRLTEMIKAMGMSEVKLKVGRSDDLERLASLRKALGPEVSIRVDANACWTSQEALANIQAMRPFNVAAVEQPVAAEDLAGLASLRQAVEPLILADESCCTPGQARALIDAGAVDGFNLRLSKCGGPARTLALLELALANGLKAQMGCQVGELGILSALGRHLACARSELIFLEGSLGKYYVQGDVIEEDISFGPGGQAEALPGWGLGVTAREEALRPFHLVTLD